MPLKNRSYVSLLALTNRENNWKMDLRDLVDLTRHNDPNQIGGSTDKPTARWVF